MKKRKPSKITAGRKINAKAKAGTKAKAGAKATGAKPKGTPVQGRVRVEYDGQNLGGRKPLRLIEHTSEVFRDFKARKSAARRALDAEVRRVVDIKIGKRARKDMGALASLVRSINLHGLLHPVVITPDNKLIAGGRRIEAWKLSAHRLEPIPVTVVDIDSIVRGEHDENAERKDFTPSEMVAIKIELEPQFKAEAKDRQRDHGKTARGRKASSKDEGAGRAADKVAKIAGVSRHTLDKAEAVVNAAKAEPEKYGKLKDDMDRKGSVNGAFRRLQVMKQTEQIRSSAPGVPMNGPYGVVAIDFPWPHEPEMSQEDLDAQGRSLRPYPAMSIKAGCKFMSDKVKPILANDCVVYFWTTNFHMPFAFHLLQALGFRQHTTIGTWRKDRMGRGAVLRDKTEHCIIAIRGKPVINLTNETTDWSGEGWERRENSRKPAGFYELVERLTPAPRYAEIFSRGGLNSRWDSHGDEVGKFNQDAQSHPIPDPESAATLPPKSKKLTAKAEQMPMATAPASALEQALRSIPDEEIDACRGRLCEIAPQVKNHAFTMSVEGDLDVGVCECGATFAFPRSDDHRHMDLAIEQHWQKIISAEKAAEDQLTIPGFLRRKTNAVEVEAQS